MSIETQRSRSVTETAPRSDRLFKQSLKHVSRITNSQISSTIAAYTDAKLSVYTTAESRNKQYKNYNNRDLKLPSITSNENPYLVAPSATQRTQSQTTMQNRTSRQQIKILVAPTMVDQQTKQLAIQLQRLDSCHQLPLNEPVRPNPSTPRSKSLFTKLQTRYRREPSLLAERLEIACQQSKQ